MGILNSLGVKVQLAFPGREWERNWLPFSGSRVVSKAWNRT